MTEPKVSEAVMQAIRAGRKIQAIKQLRQETGLGLKEAKQIVDREVAAYRLANPDAQAEQGSSKGSLVIVVILIAVAIYFYVSQGA